MATYKEEVVGEETLLARRQESLDSVHFCGLLWSDLS